MDTTTLRTFIALAQIKNFTKTAQQLFVAQSTVTNRIRDLETELGKSLFVRNHKQVELTPAGGKIPRLCPAVHRTGNHGLPGSPEQFRLCPEDSHRLDKYDL